jgi:hypothetical protein
MQDSIRTFLFLILAPGLFFGCDKEAPEALVEIPDHGFMDALLGQGVDSNGDGLISMVEAEAVKTLVIPPSGITDLTGLEAFIRLDSFSITLNPLSGIDLTASTALRYLEATSCELSSLDVSHNLLLETLICGRNNLSELDVSHNQSLLTLVANNNLFTSLDLSANTRLRTMISCGNQLSSLDISRLSGLTSIGVDNMPMLTEVCVWTLPFPPEGIVVLQGFSPNIIFTTTCSM